MAEETIELREILWILRKRIWILILITFFATAASGIVSYFFMTPIYEASTQLLVNSKDSETKTITPNDIRFSLDVIQTYIEVITSPRILEKAIADMNLNTTVGQLKEKLDVSTVKQSQIISLTVTDPDQKRAAEIANGIAKTFQAEIPQIMKVDNVQILAQAKVEDHPVPVKPKPVLNMAIAFVVGLFSAIGLIFLLEYLDNTIKNEADVERYLGLPVLGMVSPITDKDVLEISKRMGKESTLSDEPVKGGTHLEA